jgi:hypothetical protein
VGGDGTGTLAITEGGSIEVASAYQQATNGTLRLSLGSLSSYGSLQVNGSAALAGNLLVTLAGGFEPAPGDQFLLVDAGSIAGQFASVQLPAKPIDSVWDLLTTVDGIVLELYWSADFNRNRVVDGEDLADWRIAFGNTDDADADADGDADGFDFLAWQRQLGRTSAVVSASSSVPEPTTAMLAVALALCMMGGYRHRQVSPPRRGK